MFFDRLLKLDFSRVTSNEIWIMVLGYLIVFLVLSALYLIFQNLPGLLNIGSTVRTFYKKKADINIPSENPEEKKQPKAVSGELNAAISAAIHLYTSEQHDEENTILTIKKVSRRYSPWSSKIYSVTNLRRN